MDKTGDDPQPLPPNLFPIKKYYELFLHERSVWS
jgi:hypothetical protein